MVREIFNEEKSMTREQFLLGMNIIGKTFPIRVRIKSNLRTTEKRFGVNNSMRACAGTEDTYVVDRLIEVFKCYLKIPLRGDKETLQWEVFVFDAGDVELLIEPLPSAKQEPVLLAYDLEAAGKMFS
jgi:hypothetical protein